MELKKAAHGNSDIVIPVPFLKNLIITLGFTAIIINLAMNLVYLMLMLSADSKKISSWLAIANFLFLILQVYYFFFYKD